MGVYGAGDAASQAIEARAFRDRVGAAESEEFDSASQLPALSDGDPNADAGVTARPEADGDAVDLSAIEGRLRQRLLD